LLLHVRKDVLKDGIKIDPSKMNLIGRMGENFYCKAFGESIFAIPKAQGIGMGYDNLPIHIKNSNVLSGNNLGQLASLPHMPSPQEIEEVSLYPEVKLILEKKDRKWRKQLHQLARQFLDKNEYAIAFSILMTGD